MTIEKKTAVIKANHAGTETKETILIGQWPYSSDVEAFMLNSNLLVIATSEAGPNYMYKQQAMEMFNLVEGSVVQNKDNVAPLKTCVSELMAILLENSIELPSCIEKRLESVM